MDLSPGTAALACAKTGDELSLPIALIRTPHWASANACVLVLRALVFLRWGLNLVFNQAGRIISATKMHLGPQRFLLETEATIAGEMA